MSTFLSKHKKLSIPFSIFFIFISIFIIIFIIIITIKAIKAIKAITTRKLLFYSVENFGNYDENHNYYNLTCDKYFKFMIDPINPNTVGCYISFDDYRKYYNPTIYDCPKSWFYNTTIDGVKYCRQNSANLPLTDVVPATSS